MTWLTTSTRININGWSSVSNSYHDSRTSNNDFPCRIYYCPSEQEIFLFTSVHQPGDHSPLLTKSRWPWPNTPPLWTHGGLLCPSYFPHYFPHQNCSIPIRLTSPFLLLTLLWSMIAFPVCFSTFFENISLLFYYCYYYWKVGLTPASWIQTHLAEQYPQQNPSSPF